MPNEYAELLLPDPRRYYHYLLVLPAVDRSQYEEEEVRGGGGVGPGGAGAGGTCACSAEACGGAQRMWMPRPVAAADNRARVSVLARRKRRHAHRGQPQLRGQHDLAAGALRCCGRAMAEVGRAMPALLLLPPLPPSPLPACPRGPCRRR